jgi:hypothetical protein
VRGRRGYANYVLAAQRFGAPGRPRSGRKARARGPEDRDGAQPRPRPVVLGSANDDFTLVPPA